MKKKILFWFFLLKDFVLSLFGIGLRLYIKEVESKKLMSRYVDRLFLDKFMFVYSLGKLKLNYKIKNEFV